MLTFQDLIDVGEEEEARTSFVYDAIGLYKGSEQYKTAKVADDYDARKNATIVAFQKLLYTVSGSAVPDNFSANFKLCSGFFPRFVAQETQYLLGNGVTWSEETTGDALGEDFDARLQEIAHNSLVHGVAYGFWNLDRVKAFSALEFVPLYDEENGALMAGIRFWQIDKNKPLRATLYELDGYTEYIRRQDGKPEILKPKQAYKLKVKQSVVDGVEIYDGENYPTFPIVPLYGNKRHQSELVGIREQIDAYDLIKSGYANDVDDASMIYWTITNAGGMDDIDLAKFVDRMRTVKAAVVDDAGSRAESHTMDVPYASREAILERLRSDLYDDYMALDTKNIASGVVTATQIKAAYEPMNIKADAFEYCVLDFLQGILALAGIDDNPTFTRSVIVNAQEEAQTLLLGASYLESGYVTEKLLTLLGDGDRAEDMVAEIDANELGNLPLETETEEVEYGQSTSGNGEGAETA